MGRALVGLSALLALSACQLVAPLPDAEGAAGGGGSTGVLADAASSTVGGGGCGEPACASYCDEVVSVCAEVPQYPSVDACCASCEVLGPAGLTCRAAPKKKDPKACTQSGPVGKPGLPSCVTGCAAVCALFEAACSDVEASAVGKCQMECAMNPFDGVFMMCDDDPFSCRLEQILRALEADSGARKEHCHKAAHHECAPCAG